jgi:tetratricopeptide (TPR) repeat protein
MVSKPFAIAVASLFLGTLGFAQPGSALADKTAPKPAAPARPLSTEERGDIMMARKMYREAIEAFESDSQKNAVIYNKIGIAYHQLQQLDNAKRNYERALRLKRDYAEAMNNIGTVYYARKSYRRAISYYQKALRITPESASIYSNLGTALFARKKYDDATEAYQKALTLDPEVFERRSNYGTMLEDRNVEERAKFHYYLAKMYAKSGRNEMAMQYVRKALEEGFKDKKKFQEEPEFQALRGLPEFQDLMTAEPRVL